MGLHERTAAGQDEHGLRVPGVSYVNFIVVDDGRDATSSDTANFFISNFQVLLIDFEKALFQLFITVRNRILEDLANVDRVLLV